MGTIIDVINAVFYHVCSSVIKIISRKITLVSFLSEANEIAEPGLHIIWSSSWSNVFVYLKSIEANKKMI